MAVIVMTAIKCSQISATTCGLRLAGDELDVCVGKAVVLPAEVTAVLAAELVLSLALVVEIGTVAVVVVDLVDDDRLVLIGVTSSPVVFVEYCSQSVAVFR